jgi:hypothetical protein
MNNNSRKAKSRYLQNIVKDKIINLFKLNPADIRTSNTGENGEDIKLLSITSKRVFLIPWSAPILSNTLVYIENLNKLSDIIIGSHFW